LPSLDHDNMGEANAKVMDADGNEVDDPTRDEVIFIRQTMPGTYAVNVGLRYHEAAPDLSHRDHSITHP
jgi:hypothetical protein